MTTDNPDKLRQRLRILHTPVRMFERTYKWWTLGVVLPVTIIAGAEYATNTTIRKEQTEKEEVIETKIYTLEGKIQQANELFQDSTYILTPEHIQSKDYAKLHGTRENREEKQEQLYEMNINHYQEKLETLKEKHNNNQPTTSKSTMYMLMGAYIPLFIGIKLEQMKQKYETKLEKVTQANHNI